MDHTYFALQKRVMTKCLIVILNDYIFRHPATNFAQAQRFMI